MTTMSLHSHLTRFSQRFSKFSLVRFFSHHPSDFELQRQLPKCLVTEAIPLALYGGRNTVTMLPGIGIGPAICEHVRSVIRYMGAPIDFEVIDIDPERKSDEELEYAVISVKRNGVAIKGNIEKKTELSYRLNNLILRNELDLYVYVLWCKSYPGVPAKHPDVDIVLIRQNTEGEYSMLEHSIGDERVVESLKIVRRDRSKRIAKYAFDYAKKYGRKKVTTIHKANIMKLSDGLFLEMSKEVAKDYPDIEHNNMIVDAFCMHVVSNPKQFDVILAPNLFGSIIANVICGLSGGPGLMSGKNYGQYYAIFEPGTRNSATTLIGQNVANPIAMLNACVDMLKHLGHGEYGSSLHHAIYKTICEDKVYTPDLGGTATTEDVINKILEYV